MRPPADDAKVMRMAELATRSGVARETIHFYLREGLLPKPRKGGKTVAYYGEEHLERLRTIRRLREEKYLPLAVIRRLLDSPVAAAPRDIDVLAEVLHLGAPAMEESSFEAGTGRAPSAEAVKVAEDLGLLGPARGGGEIVDSADLRVLAVVEEALSLRPEARALTLADLSECAVDLTALVTREAELFFDTVLRSGDIGRSIAALREGRGAVARFITAYRDRMLRRIVDDLLVAIERGPDVAARPFAAPLSATKERELGAVARREELGAAAARGDRGALVDLVWHLFGCGASAELASLSGDQAAMAGERAAVLIAWGRLEETATASAEGLDRAVLAAPGFALGQILAGEAALVRALQRRDAGASLLEQAVPALQRLVCADPVADPEPRARALGLFHQGRVELALPAVLGRRRRGADALLRSLELCEVAADLDPAARAWLQANAHLALGRYRAMLRDEGRAAAHFHAALAIDPAGAVADAVRAARRSS